MTTRDLKDLMEEYRETTGMSRSDAETLYLDLLETHFDDVEYFNTRVEEIKAEIAEYSEK